MPRRKAAQRGFPWYRRSADAWCVTNEQGRPESLKDATGHVIKGEANEAEAVKVWGEMRAFAD
ncbi:MAG TPA: hypothetical protein VFE78_10715, partial [Gemmataceae bacterium]|nr:hypothetical protein [Gemmataceae bacterium]